MKAAVRRRADRSRCEAEYRELPPFGVPSMKRCENKTQFIVTEKGGKHGSIGFCADCLKIFQHMADMAKFTSRRINK